MPEVVLERTRGERAPGHIGFLMVGVFASLRMRKWLVGAMYLHTVHFSRHREQEGCLSSHWSYISHTNKAIAINTASYFLASLFACDTASPRLVMCLSTMPVIYFLT